MIKRTRFYPLYSMGSSTKKKLMAFLIGIDCFNIRYSGEIRGFYADYWSWYAPTDLDDILNSYGMV